jgi:hypothetical protein
MGAICEPWKETVETRNLVALASLNSKLLSVLCSQHAATSEGKQLSVTLDLEALKEPVYITITNPASATALVAGYAGSGSEQHPEREADNSSSNKPAAICLHGCDTSFTAR